MPSTVALRQYRRFLRLGQDYALHYGDPSLRTYIFGVTRAEFQQNRGIPAESPLCEELLALGGRTLRFFEGPFAVGSDADSRNHQPPPVLSRQDPQYLLLRSIRDGDVLRTGGRMTRDFRSSEWVSRLPSSGWGGVAESGILMEERPPSHA